MHPNQLLKNEVALKIFKDKYGLTVEIIEKYLIGYKNKHYVIHIEAVPGKWTYKEHKGPERGKGNGTLSLMASM